MRVLMPRTFGLLAMFKASTAHWQRAVTSFTWVEILSGLMLFTASFTVRVTSSCTYPLLA